ncbi:AI-2E family transporter [Sphingorhabdus rigui]|uniref:AI-2E family transporter n=1 Tax=Sphingorhabdus rigui TaxID=1282858 RepID=UPI002ADDD443|nr:AI-2E family transporter [Sphingorhabdus rigui]
MVQEDGFREEVGPTELYDPIIRTEIKRAAVWIGMTAFVVGFVWLAQPLLLIMGGLVLAAMFDGGARLLGRVLPIPRSIRLTIVVLAVFGFMYWTFIFTGSELAAQAASLQAIVEAQIESIGNRIAAAGFNISAEDVKGFGTQILNSVGRVTEAVSSVVGTVTNMAMMLVLAIFIAAEPRMYERGVAWMLPLAEREHFYVTAAKMGNVLRRLMAGRLLGMAVEGFGTWILLSLGGVPMAALLGVLTGLLAFLPNIGAIVSGALIILVGFSAGVDVGLYAIFVYFVVQMVDGYLIVPMVAKRAVDLAPALVLGAQILLGALFGILGLALADPIIAMIKVALERQSERNEARAIREGP